jgi:hypothetical protein
MMKPPVSFENEIVWQMKLIKQCQYGASCYAAAAWMGGALLQIDACTARKLS